MLQRRGDAFDHPRLALQAVLQRFRVVAQPKRVSCELSDPENPQTMTGRRGNPNWGHPMLPSPNIATEFEIRVKHLRLTPKTYVNSVELRTWCEHNKNRCYIPEWLLEQWGISVELSYGHDAA
jgi:hypothetical protein